MKKASLIVADCPWSFNDQLKQGSTKRGAAANYNTMSLAEIKSLPVPDICDPKGCLLALWVPSSLLPDGLEVMKQWGFHFKQTYIWVKSKKESSIEKMITKDIPKCGFMVGIRYLLDNLLSLGMGSAFRNSHEIALIGINNNGIYDKIANHSQRTVSFATNTKHSAKPEHLQDSLDLIFPNAVKVEMFARRSRNGWICLGNEVEVNGVLGQDIRVSLQDLIKQQQHTDIHTNRDANEKDPAVECVV